MTAKDDQRVERFSAIANAVHHVLRRGRLTDLTPIVRREPPRHPFISSWPTCTARRNVRETQSTV
jgi:hypothetical protein